MKSLGVQIFHEISDLHQNSQQTPSLLVVCCLHCLQEIQQGGMQKSSEPESESRRAIWSSYLFGIAERIPFINKLNLLPPELIQVLLLRTLSPARINSTFQHRINRSRCSWSLWRDWWKAEGMTAAIRIDEAKRNWLFLTFTETVKQRLAFSTKSELNNYLSLFAHAAKCFGRDIYLEMNISSIP